MKEKLKFKVGASFFALAFLALITKNAFFFGTYILAVVIHEFCHAAAARRLGYKAVEIYLSAFGAVLYGEFEGAALSDEIKIALAGPAVNLCAAALLPAVWWMFPPLYAFTQSFSSPICASRLSTCFHAIRWTAAGCFTPYWAKKRAPPPKKFW